MMRNVMIEFDKDRYMCECEVVFRDDEILQSLNPFEPAYTIYGCLVCKEAEKFGPLCEIEDCTQNASCGLLVSNNYCHVCGRHYWISEQNEKA